MEEVTCSGTLRNKRRKEKGHPEQRERMYKGEEEGSMEERLRECSSGG